METIKQLLDFVLHLQEHLHGFTRDHGPWVYAILFAIIFAETGLVVLPFLPGDSLLFAIGAVAANPASGLNVWVALAIIPVAALLGDTVNYAVGHFAGARLSAKYPQLIKPSYLVKTREFFDRYGGKTIVMARFVPIVRTFTPFVAGSGGMNYRRFIAYSIGGACLWAGLLVPAGWFFGGLPWVKQHFELVVIGIIFISIVPMLVEVIRAWMKTRKAM